MEGGTEQDNHEFEMLLGEIPNVTSGNPRKESTPLKTFSGLQNHHPLEEDSKRSSPPSAFTNFYRCSSQAGGPSRNVGFYGSLPSENTCCSSNGIIVNQECHTNGHLDGEKTNAANGNGYRTPPRIENLEDSNLPDDQSLASALITQLSFKDGGSNGQVDPHVVHNNIPKCTFLCQGKYQNNLDKSYMSLDTHSVSASTTLDVQESKNQNGWSSHPHGNLSGEQRQYLPVYSGANPSPSMPSLQVLPSNYLPRVDFSVVPYQQQIFYDAHGIPYIQQPISRSHIPWQHMDDENYYRLQQQYHMQQFRSQVPDAHHPQANGTTLPINGNARQPYLKVNNPHQVEQTKENCFCDYAPVQSLDRSGRHNIPEKILTKSHGLNHLKSINASPISGNGVVCHGNNEKRLSNGHFHQHSLNSGSFYFDGRFSPGSPPDSLELGMYALRAQPPRSQPPRYNSLDEIVGSIYHIAKDQYGCRFLQKKFTEGCPEDVDKIFIEIIGHIVELMTDPFGNYLVQKLLEVCTNDQKTQILQAITRKPVDLVRISLDMHGTRAVQKVIETLKTREQFSLIVSSLKPGIVSLMKDTNGNHVAQKCLERLLPEYKEFLFEDAISHCSKLAKDRHACCVLQKCLSHCSGEHRRRLVCGITSDALNLSQNQYGNYVVQYVFELHLSWATASVLDKLEGSYGYLSMQKYSSNVVEKCLKFAGEDRRPRIVQELITDSRLDQILQDPYGNYVVQAALNHSKGAIHAALVEAIRPHVPALRTSPYGKKILSSNGLKK